MPQKCKYNPRIFCRFDTQECVYENAEKYEGKRFPYKYRGEGFYNFFLKDNKGNYYKVIAKNFSVTDITTWRDEWTEETAEIWLQRIEEEDYIPTSNLRIRRCLAFSPVIPDNNVLGLPEKIYSKVVHGIGWRNEWARSAQEKMYEIINQRGALVEFSNIIQPEEIVTVERGLTYLATGTEYAIGLSIPDRSPEDFSQAYSVDLIKIGLIEDLIGEAEARTWRIVNGEKKHLSDLYDKNGAQICEGDRVRMQIMVSSGGGGQYKELEGSVQCTRTSDGHTVLAVWDKSCRPARPVLISTPRRDRVEVVARGS